MLGTILGFGGRMGRLSYFLMTLVLGFAMTVLTLGIVFGMMPHYVAAGGKLPDEVPTPILMTTLLVVGPLFLWFSLALQAKRIRDIGWKPLFVIPAWIGLNVVDVIVASFTSSSAGDHHNATAFGALVNLAMVGVLLFWPSGERDEWTPPSFGTGMPEPEVSPRPAASPRTSRTAVAAPPGFGRRRAI